jgi:hypothetical protein
MRGLGQPETTRASRLLMGIDPTPTSSDAASARSDPAQPYLDTANSIRSRVDFFGKALGAVGTTLVTAAGVSRLDSLFPLPPGSHGELLVVGAIVSFVVGVVIVLVIAVRLTGVAGPISLQADLDYLVESGEIDDSEKGLAEEVYGRTAALNHASTLLAYEARGLAFQRIASWIDDADVRRICLARAAEISQDVRVTLARASVVIVRRRSTRAVGSFEASGLYLAFLGAIVGFALTTGSLVSEQTTQITIAKSCADLRAAQNAAAKPPSVSSSPPLNTLPGICSK